VLIVFAVADIHVYSNFVVGELCEVSKQKKIRFLLLTLAKVFNNNDAMGAFCSSWQSVTERWWDNKNVPFSMC